MLIDPTQRTPDAVLDALVLGEPKPVSCAGDGDAATVLMSFPSRRGMVGQTLRKR